MNSEKREPKKEELGVITKAKKLCEYIFVATKNAPKLYRWNIVDKLLNGSSNMIKDLLQANDTECYETRYSLQRRVDSEFKYFSFLLGLAQEIQVLRLNQLEHASNLLLETRRALWMWIKSNPHYNSKKETQKKK